MRGIQSVFTALLIMVIIIAFAGFFYTFYSFLTTSTVETASETISGTTKQTSQPVRIESIVGDKISIRNLGDGYLDTTQLAIFAVSGKVDFTGPSVIGSGQIETFEITNFLSSSGLVKVTAQSGFLSDTRTADFLLIDNFNDDDDSGWTKSGSWSVQSGEYVAAPPEAISLAGKSFTSGTFNAVVRITQILTSTGPGLIVGYHDNDNYYLAGLGDEAGKGYAIYKKTAIGLQNINSTEPATDIKANSYVIKVVFRPPIVELYVNGILKVSYTDTSMSSGDFGLRSQTDVGFDNIVVRP